MKSKTEILRLREHTMFGGADPSGIKTYEVLYKITTHGAKSMEDVLFVPAKDELEAYQQAKYLLADKIRRT
jgi:hypothetical protein